MKFYLLLFFYLFAAGACCAVASALIYFAMIGEVNRKRRDDSQISYFLSPWFDVFREYRSRYPEGKFARALTIAGSLALVFGLGAVYVLFGVLPAYMAQHR
ncbi:MAG: hypothetical protein WBE72_00325 [Terracidiphilus sp.]